MLRDNVQFFELLKKVFIFQGWIIVLIILEINLIWVNLTRTEYITILKPWFIYLSKITIISMNIWQKPINPNEILFLNVFKL